MTTNTVNKKIGGGAEACLAEALCLPRRQMLKCRSRLEPLQRP